MYFLSLLVVTLLTIPACGPYQQYNLASVCGSTGSTSSLYLGREESVFSLDCPHQELQECHLQLRVFSDHHGQAVFINKMKYASCESDYLQFGRSSYLGMYSYKSTKYCQDMDPPKEVFNIDGSLQKTDFGSTPYSSRVYVEESVDQMDVWISLSPTQHTESECVSFVVTPFAKLCMEYDADYRQCPGSDSCVRRQLFCDGVVNCPHAQQESEETSCKFLHRRGGKFNNLPLSFFMVFVVMAVGTVALMAGKTVWDNSEKRKAATREEEDRKDTLFKIKNTKPVDNPYSTATAPPLDCFMEDHYKLCKEQAEDCTRVDCGESRAKKNKEEYPYPYPMVTGQS
eukprot:GFUD01044119.1.p1 GENE.GFUD01044119.1~~GFUD01044119.1.p1  ORF type:complete len:342 (+),score=117.79 GFUD01044119.1:44-1069(+)